MTWPQPKEPPNVRYIMSHSDQYEKMQTANTMINFEKGADQLQ